MHITLETDYAFSIMDCLVRNKNKRIGAQTISELTGVSLRFSLKILRKLVASGLVRSFKGSTGGYEINKDPSEISLNDILLAIEGDYHFSRCGNSDHICPRREKSDCPYHRVFGGVSDIVTEKLSDITVEQMVLDDPKGFPRSH